MDDKNMGDKDMGDKDMDVEDVRALALVMRLLLAVVLMGGGAGVLWGLYMIISEVAPRLP